MVCEQQVSDIGIVGYRGPNPARHQWYNHMPAAKIKSYVGDEIWNDYFEFCVIRNPFDKLVSAYHFYEWLIDNAKGWRKKKLILDHGLVPRKNMDDIKRFRSWVAWARWFNDRSIYVVDQQVCIDFFIRYERLQEDIKTVCQNLDVPYQPDKLPFLLARINLHERKTQEYYDAGTIRLVRKRFAFELEYFDYEFPE